jgi:hypothetical protein
LINILVCRRAIVRKSQQGGRERHCSPPLFTLGLSVETPDVERVTSRLAPSRVSAAQSSGDLTAGTRALVQRRRRKLHLSAAPSR